MALQNISAGGAGAGAGGDTGLWKLHYGWLKTSPGTSGFEGYKRDTLLGSVASKKWKDRWAVVTSNKVCLFMDERCIQEIAMFALGPKATVELWQAAEDSESEEVSGLCLLSVARVSHSSAKSTTEAHVYFVSSLSCRRQRKKVRSGSRRASLGCTSGKGCAR